VLTRQEKAELIRDYMKEINTLVKELEGDGCSIKIHCNDPYNNIDFITIERTSKL